MRFHHADEAVPPRLPEDKGGWRVAPADGRGMPGVGKAGPATSVAGFWIFLLVLLAINWVSLLMVTSSGERRVKVPFSPYFIQQVQAGQVKSISSRGATAQTRTAG